jgi:NAD(P)-dependent dehydrogenase (short-subunit alcohol dehydrogenase family)
MASLNGKVAVVTGASRGIGRAIALALGQSGSRVAVTYMHRREPAEEVVAMLQAQGAEGRAYQFDVADFDATGTAFSQITNDFGGLDILVNNAGIRDDQLLVRMQPEAWESVIRTNLSGTFNCARAGDGL